jgi:hypothetical protein
MLIQKTFPEPAGVDRFQFVLRRIVDDLLE